MIRKLLKLYRIVFWSNEKRAKYLGVKIGVMCDELVKRGHDVHLATNIDIPFAYDLNESVNEVFRADSRYNNLKNNR